MDTQKLKQFTSVLSTNTNSSPSLNFPHHFTKALIDVGVKPDNSSPSSNNYFTNPLIGVGVKPRNSSPSLKFPHHLIYPSIDIGTKPRNSSLSNPLVHVVTIPSKIWRPKVRNSSFIYHNNQSQYPKLTYSTHSKLQHHLLPLHVFQSHISKLLFPQNP